MVHLRRRGRDYRVGSVTLRVMHRRGQWPGQPAGPTSRPSRSSCPDHPLDVACQGLEVDSRTLSPPRTRRPRPWRRFRVRARSPYRLRHCPSDSAARLRAMFILARSALSTYAPPRDHSPPSCATRQGTAQRAGLTHRGRSISTRWRILVLCHRPMSRGTHRTPSCHGVDVEVGCRQPDRLITTSVGFLVRPATDRAHQLRTPALRLPSVPARTIRRVAHSSEFPRSLNSSKRRHHRVAGWRDLNDWVPACGGA